jgi:hypothetical protein
MVETQNLSALGAKGAEIAPKAAVFCRLFIGNERLAVKA